MYVCIFYFSYSRPMKSWSISILHCVFFSCIVVFPPRAVVRFSVAGFSLLNQHKLFDGFSQLKKYVWLGVCNLLNYIFNRIYQCIFNGYFRFVRIAGHRVIAFCFTLRSYEFRVERREMGREFRDGRMQVQLMHWHKPNIILERIGYVCVLCVCVCVCVVDAKADQRWIAAQKFN